MQNSEWKRLVMGLMSLNDDKVRIEEMEKILYDLGHNWEDKKLLHMGCWRGCDFYINGDKQDADEFERFMKRAENDRNLIAAFKI